MIIMKDLNRGEDHPGKGMSMKMIIMKDLNRGTEDHPYDYDDNNDEDYYEPPRR